MQATGEASYRCMELLDAANTGAFGDPEPVQVPLTIEKGPFIVISGHDLYLSLIHISRSGLRRAGRCRRGQSKPGCNQPHR